MIFHKYLLNQMNAFDILYLWYTLMIYFWNNAEKIAHANRL